VNEIREQVLANKKFMKMDWLAEIQSQILPLNATQRMALGIVSLSRHRQKTMFR
jgi:hypothetical protein